MEDDDLHGPRRTGASREDQRRWGYDVDEDLHARGVRQDRRQFGGGPAGPKGWQRSDERIHDDVCERLSRSGLDAADVSVQVRDGRVTLSGTVSDRPMKHAIESLVDGCVGVRDIDNRVKVMRPGPDAGPRDAPAPAHASVPQDSPTARDEARGRFSRPLPGAAGKAG
jgi:hypothetical protein